VTNLLTIGMKIQIKRNHQYNL